MKIVLCDNGLPGLVRFRYDVISHFVKQGHDVLLIYPLCTESAEWLEQLPDGVRKHAVDYNPSSTSPVNDLKLFWKLFRLYISEKPNLCIHYTIKPNIYGTLAAKLCRIKNIALVAGLGYMFQGDSVVKRVGRLLYKIGLRNADHVVTLNKVIRDLLVNKRFVDGSRLSLFECGEGVNLERYPLFVQKYEAPVRFLTVARVFYDKGYEEYSAASEIVHQKYPDVVFEWLGDYDELSPMTVSRTKLETDIAEGRISYLGTTDDVLQYLHRDGVCICLPSYHEGLSKSLMEACAIGLPIIASDIPGCRETVDEGINGYLVPPRDPNALAEAICRFIELSQEEKKEMACASYKKAKDVFDVTKVLEKYDKIIDSLLQTK